MGGWIKSCNGGLYDFNSSPYIIKKIEARNMRWARHVLCIGAIINAYKLLVGKSARRIYGTYA
jgi:hypothetical protein